MKKLLLVVDYQKDFVDGAIGFPGAEKLEAGILEKIAACRAAGDAVWFTLDTHGDDYMSTQEGRKLPVPHCIRGSAGWQLYGALPAAVREGDLVLEKPTFGSYELGELLRREGFEAVELVGLVTNICVIANALVAKAALPEAEIAIDAALTASFDPVLHEKTLDVAEGLQITVQNRATA